MKKGEGNELIRADYKDLTVKEVRNLTEGKDVVAVGDGDQGKILLYKEEEEG